MASTKQLADLITLARALLFVMYIWLGITQGAEGLPIAVTMLIANWTADSIDGPLARRSGINSRTWIGDHDLEIDMFVSVGCVVYLVLANFISWQLAGLYLLFWLVLFWRSGISKSLAAVFQAFIYAYFIYVALRFDAMSGLLFITWMLVAMIVTWPKFPKVIVPEFLSGMRDWWENLR